MVVAKLEGSGLPLFELQKNPDEHNNAPPNDEVRMGGSASNLATTVGSIILVTSGELGY